MKDEHGKTRRERNDGFDTLSPAVIIPAVARYLWDWYFEVSDALVRAHDGASIRIPWTEWEAWKGATGHIVRSSEHDILRAMDTAYCAEMSKELADFRERERERAEQKAANKRKAR